MFAFFLFDKDLFINFRLLKEKLSKLAQKFMDFIQCYLNTREGELIFH